MTFLTSVFPFRPLAVASVVATALVLAGCSSGPPATDDKIVRAVPPQNAAKSIESYFDVTVRGKDPNRELTIGTPQRGSCPMGGGASGGYVGWVVPVDYKTRSRDNGRVIVSTYFFWFSEEVIRGVTRRMEVCP